MCRVAHAGSRPGHLDLSEKDHFEVLDRPHSDMWWCRRVGKDATEGWVNPLFLDPLRSSQSPHTESPSRQPWANKHEYYDLHLSAHSQNPDHPDYNNGLHSKVYKISIPDNELNEVRGNPKDLYSLQRRHRPCFLTILFVFLLIYFF